jgi:hypothetical protein
MKKIVFLILCMAMISAVTFADDEKSQQDSGDRMAKKHPIRMFRTMNQLIAESINPNISSNNYESALHSALDQLRGILTAEATIEY